MNMIKFLNSMLPDIKSGRKTQTRRLVKIDVCPHEVGEIIRVIDENLIHAGFEIEIISTRKERLQDISEQDCIAEGIGEELAAFDEVASNMGFIGVNLTRLSFKSLWQSIYSNWDENPYVWVIEFKVVRND